MRGRPWAYDYLAGADPKTPLASLFAPLPGLPPLLAQVATAVLLLSDSERLATAAEAGVEVIPGDRRGLAPRLPDHARHPEAAEATEQIGKFPRARRQPASP